MIRVMNGGVIDECFDICLCAKTKARLIEEKQDTARQQQQTLQEKLKTSNEGPLWFDLLRPLRVGQGLLTDKKAQMDESQKTVEKLKKVFAKVGVKELMCYCLSIKKRVDAITLREDFLKCRDEMQQQRQQLESREALLSEERTESTLIPRILQARDDGR